MGKKLRFEAVALSGLLIATAPCIAIGDQSGKTADQQSGQQQRGAAGVGRASGDQTMLVRHATEAIDHAIKAEEAGEKGDGEGLLKHAQKALSQTQEAQKVGHNEDLNQAAFALSDAIEHERKGQTKDAREHVMQAIMNLSQASKVPGSGSVKDSGQTIPNEMKVQVSKALMHAKEAKDAGEKGNAESLVRHAEMALNKAKEAQKAGPNERLNEGVYALGDAIEHGRKGQAKDAREHVMHAIMRMSQAIGTQIPPHATELGSAGDSKATGAESIKGEVLVKGELLRIESDDFYVVKEASGKEVHLFVGKDKNRGFNVGDKIQAQVASDGQVRSIKKLEANVGQSSQ